ncbi:MAG TPA: N-acetyltransferase [Planctomycetaceae bacterium]|nr:N-acetyltransferase [Planctomycetaceae bacterium]
MNVTITVVDYVEHEEAIRQIRDEVFIREQQVSREDEFDGRDRNCIHVLATAGGEAVGTGRLDLGQAGKIGRVAVLGPFRKLGIGRKMMLELENVAREQQLDGIWFHAQLTAVSFYKRLGYQTEGDEFEEAGIRHVTMRKEFTKSEDEGIG